MLREDTSPVKARIEALALSSPEISFKACGNTRENMSKAEGKEVPLISEAQIVKSGVVRVMELQEQGWTYVKPPLVHGRCCGPDRKRFADPLVRSMTGACKAGRESTRWRYDCRRQNGRPIGRLEGEPRQSA
jgi:hypothetical protein